MGTLSYSPSYPMAGEEVTLSVTSPTGNATVWEVLSRPALSSVPLTSLDLNRAFTGRTAQQVAQDSAALDTFTPDVAGEYTVIGYEFQHFAVATPYDGAPQSEKRWYLVASTTGTVHVADTADLPIVNARGDGATLRITVSDTTVRGAELVSPTSEVARIAALDSSVTSTLTALVGVAVTSIGNGLQADANDLRSKYESHRAVTGAGVHAVADSTNACPRDDTASEADAIALVNDLAFRLTGHAVPTSPPTTAWHSGSDDTKNTLGVAPVASSKAQATVLLACLRERLYERHRNQTASPAVHGAADNTYALTAPTRLDATIVAFVDALETASLAAAAGESEGLDDAARLFGFTR